MSFFTEEANSETEVSALRHLSRKVYFAVNKKVGSEDVVKLRRNKFDILDTLNNCDTTSPFIRIVRGSYSEGFAFPSSDVDIMLIHKDIIIFPKGFYVSQQNYEKYKTILRIVNDGLPPGFVMLRCVKFNSSGNTIVPFLIPIANDVFFSSSLYRDFMRNMTRKLFLHGPCVAGTVNDLECDFGPCLYSPFWPDQGYAFIERSIKSRWPEQLILTDICNDGCLFVPINAKEKQCNTNDIEWRISFSLAEKRIVSSLNHTQFLTYGLLKLFLTDVLKRGIHDELLSSYHMKVALFWEISENAHHWSYENILDKFWNIFRRILKWISIEYFPHFFISERNMFKGKLYGTRTNEILDRLRPLYEEGKRIILRCFSLAEEMETIRFTIESYPFLFTDHRRIHHTEIDQIDAVLQFRNMSCTDIKSLETMLLNTMRIRSYSAEMKSALTLRVNYLLQRIVEGNLDTYLPNKYFYKLQSKSINILKRARTFLLENEMTLMIYYYKSGQYVKAINTAQRAKQMLRQNYVMFILNLDSMFIAGSIDTGLSLDEIVKSSIVTHATFHPDYTIEELLPECLAKTSASIDAEIGVPPLVFLDFILLLSYNRIEDIRLRNEVLKDLCVLICYDDSLLIHYLFKAISYEILGICQQICGYRDSAFTSYMIAMNDKYNYFKNATLARIQSLHL